MSKRSDIIDGSKAATAKYGLVYTCHLGWIDLGHAQPTGAAGLWRTINGEIGDRSRDGKGYRAVYSQMMGNKHIKVGMQGQYYVKLGLTKKQKESVALAIFMAVSHRFESMQGNWLFRNVTDSSYSAEDLVSNLLGFYRAVRPGVNYVVQAKPVSKAAAENVWDTYGAVGSNKNTAFGPFIYPCAECPSSPQGPMCGQLPQSLNAITPEKIGNNYRKWKVFGDSK